VSELLLLLNDLAWRSSKSERLRFLWERYARGGVLQVSEALHSLNDYLFKYWMLPADA
jgi:hypothetical protein